MPALAAAYLPDRPALDDDGPAFHHHRGTAFDNGAAFDDFDDSSVDTAVSRGRAVLGLRDDGQPHQRTRDPAVRSACPCPVSPFVHGLMIPAAVYLILAGLLVLGVAVGDVRERRRRRAEQ